MGANDKISNKLDDMAGKAKEGVRAVVGLHQHSHIDAAVPVGEFVEPVRAGMEAAGGDVRTSTKRPEICVHARR